MCVRRSRRETQLSVARSRCATHGRGSDAENAARRGRTRWLDVEDAPTCGRLVVAAADRHRLDERWRSSDRRGFRLPRFGDKRRHGGGIVAAGCRRDLRTRRRRTRCVVASHRTVMVFSRGAGAPQFTAKRPGGSPGQHRHDQQRRRTEHRPASRGASAVPSRIRSNGGKSARCGGFLRRAPEIFHTAREILRLARAWSLP